MLKDIWIPRLIDILPQNILDDKKMYAAAEALDLELKALSYDAWQVLHLPRLDELNHDVLDTLAYQFHVDHYEPSSMALEVKRNLIRQSILWHRIKGTPASVENFLGAFGIGAETQEWWEYGGEPYFFKLKMSESAFLGDDGDIFLRLVYAAKNERSWLDAFIFDLTKEPPDTEINLGNPYVITDKVNVENHAAGDLPTKIYVKNPIVDCDKNVIDYGTQGTLKLEYPTRFGYVIGIASYTEIASEVVESEIDWEWELFLRKIWRKWNHNPIIKEYAHHFPLKPVIIDPDPDDPTPDELISGNWLRLYFKFPYSRYQKTVTIANPREDIKGAEINSLSAYVTENHVIKNSRHQISDGIVRALYIKKSVENIFGGTGDAGYIHPPKDDKGKRK